MSFTNLLTRDEVNSLGGQVCLTDRDEKEGLENIHYMHCDEGSSAFLKKCRGQVWKGDRLILEAFPFTPEITIDRVDEYVSDDTGGYRMFESHEGFIIRLFWFGERWWVTTNRKLNAYKNRWVSRVSFGDQWEEAVKQQTGSDRDEFTSRLNKEYQYIFLVRHDARNRIVCAVPEEGEQRIYHVGTYVDGKLDLDVAVPGIPHPTEKKWEGAGALVEGVRKVDPEKMQGYILFYTGRGRGDEHVKILNTEYSELFAVRGNEMSVCFRYLQLRNDAEKVAMLEYLYPEYRKQFDMYEDILVHSASNILKAYVARFIRKEFASLPQQEYTILQKVHGGYLRTREKVNIGKILKVMDMENPSVLNRIIKSYRSKS